MEQMTTTAKKNGMGLNMFRSIAEAIVIDVWETNREKPPLRLVGMCFIIYFQSKVSRDVDSRLTSRRHLLYIYYMAKYMERNMIKNLKM